MVRDRADAILALAEMFRTYGFESASLATIEKHTGLGRGSLYHFFPGGKNDMARAVLDEVGAWFAREVYAPLREDGPPAARIEAMFTATGAYFRSRHLVCLFGAMAIGRERERFGDEIRGYFRDWIDALTVPLEQSGAREAGLLATDVVGGIQGALVLARALHDDDLFTRSLDRLQAQVIG
ncbi:TetR/AcrR family transcriptional regulator [Catenuloplanes japonicus]|uniref:TetR/AcrR family transcriptional regulator n=1 Tax=Catenuloplanes japonicus TaxID=33876 RepID=UPI000A7587DD|nr:TetR/AcrR family transcriptional regulator [Catenuloplanes japonicus]